MLESSKTKMAAPPYLKKSFLADPVRGASDQQDLTAMHMDGLVVCEIYSEY